MTKSSLPKGWRLVKFGDVVDNMNETTKDPASIGLDRVVGLDHMDPESLPLKRWDKFSDLHEGTSFTRVFRAGQVLFGKRRAYQRKVSVPDFDGICSGDILVFQPKNEELLPEFLPYLVQSDGFFDHALGTSAGSLSPRTKWQELAKYEFALPPIAEQHRIVNLMLAIDEATKNFGLVNSHSLVSSLFREFVNQKTKDWRATTIGSIAVCAGGTAFPHTFQGGITGVPFFKVGDMNKVENQRDLRFANNYVSIEEIQNLGGRVWPRGTVVFPKVGAALATEKRRILGQESLFDNNVMGLVPTDEIISEYLFLVMRNIKMRDFVQDGAVPSVNNKIVGSIPIDLPPLQEQERLLVYVSQIETLSIKISNSVSNIKMLRRSLLSDMFGQ